MQAQKRAKHRPDLRLAETYVPAAVCAAKCVCVYCFLGPVLAGVSDAGTRLFFVTAILLCLYHDHLYPHLLQPRFVDTTSLCVDVVAGTLLAHALGLDALGLHTTVAAANGVACSLWAAGGAAHVHVGKLPAPVVHGATCAAVLLVTATAHACHWSGCIAAQHHTYPFGAHLRAVLYLALVFVDAYALKPAWQRESERLHLLRYGSVLLAHCTYGLPLCFVALGAAQASRLFMTPAAQGGGEPQETSSSSSTLCTLSAADVEAFQRARAAQQRPSLSA